MKYNKIASKEIIQILKQNGLELVNQRKDYEKYASAFLLVSFGFDERENVYSAYMGNNEDMVLIDGRVIQALFTNDLDRYFIIPEKDLKDFRDNIFSLFSNFEKKIFNPNGEFLKALLQYNKKVSEEYMHELLESQRLNEADRAWQKKNYKEFLRQMESIDLENIVESYRLKIKLAKRNI